MKILLSILLSICLSANVLAQAKTKKNLSRKDLRKWELQIADNAYIFNSSRENRSQVLHALERYTELTCLNKLHLELKYKQNELSDECDKLVDRIIEHDSTNPLALCVRDGFKALSCKDAFSNQIIETDNIKDHPKYFQNIFGIRPLEALSDDSQSQGLAAQVIDNCGSSKTILRLGTKEKREVDEILKNTAIFQKLNKETEPHSLNKEEDTLLKSFENEKSDKEKEKKLEVLERVRLISAKCKNAIEALENLTPFHSFVPCYREGFYTPNCVNQKLQRKQERAKILKKQAIKKSKKKKKPKKDFSTF